MNYSLIALSPWVIKLNGPLDHLITPCDIFLSGHIKSKVYSTTPRDTDELRQRIEIEGNLLREDGALVRRVMAGTRHRMQLCVDRNGGYTEGHKRKGTSVIIIFRAVFFNK